MKAHIAELSTKVQGKNEAAHKNTPPMESSWLMKFVVPHATDTEERRLLEADPAQAN